MRTVLRAASLCSIVSRAVAETARPDPAPSLKRGLPALVLLRSFRAYRWPVRSRAGLPSGTGKRIVVPSVIQLAFSPMMLWP